MFNKCRLSVIHHEVDQFLVNKVRLGKPVASVALLDRAVYDCAVGPENNRHHVPTIIRPATVLGRHAKKDVSQMAQTSDFS